MHLGSRNPWVVAWGAGSFFLVMALIVPTATKRGWGMQGIFFAMVLSAACAYLLPLVCKRMYKRLMRGGMSMSEFGKFMAGGYSAPLLVEANSSYALLAPAETEALDAEQDEEEWDDDDEAEGQAGYDDESGEETSPEDCFHLARDLHPHADALLSGRISAFGVPGSGKSNFVAVMCEELGAKYVPLLLADTEDEYAPLVDAARSFLPRGYLAGSPDVLQEAKEPVPHFIPLEAEHAFAFGQAILEEGLQVILNLPSYGNAEEAALVMIEIIAGMQVWEQQQPLRDRVSCMFILDEAATWLPQRVEESILAPETLATLQSTIFNDVVRKGRKRGIGFILATQRIAEVDKRALQSSWRFLHQQTEDVDVRRYKALLPSLDKETVLGLLPGECIVSSPMGTMRTRIRLRYSPHGAPTPGLESVLRRYGQSRLSLRRRSTQDLTRWASHSQPASEPTTQTAHVAPESAVDLPEIRSGGETAEAPRHTTVPRLSPQLERALQAWHEGHTSGRTLAAALSITPNAAFNLLAKLDHMGLIEWRKGKSE